MQDDALTILITVNGYSLTYPPICLPMSLGTSVSMCFPFTTSVMEKTSNAAKALHSKLLNI